MLFPGDSMTDRAAGRVRGIVVPAEGQGHAHALRTDLAAGPADSKWII